MSKIMQKLHSRSGASMLLAMVFMMFCTFIGGTVLAAATANGSRVARLTQEQQSYLNQRSALLVIADQLTAGADNGLQLTIVKTDEKTPVMTTHSSELTSFQTLLYDLAATEFGFEEIKPGSITITDPVKADNMLMATYSMDKDYNFTIKFDGEALLSLSLKAAVGTMDTYRQELDSDGTVNTIKTTTTIIRWEDPVIVKGGA